MGRISQEQHNTTQTNTISTTQHNTISTLKHNTTDYQIDNNSVDSIVQYNSKEQKKRANNFGLAGLSCARALLPPRRCLEISQMCQFNFINCLPDPLNLQHTNWKKNKLSCLSTKRPKVNPHVGSWSMFLKRNHLAWLIGRLAPKMEELRKHRCRRAGGSQKTPSSLLVTQYMSSWRCCCIKESTTEKLV